MTHNEPHKLTISTTMTHDSLVTPSGICVSILIPGPPEAAHHSPANAMATASPGLCRKIKVSDLPKETRNQTVLKLYFQSLAGLVASVEMFKDSTVVTLENPIS